ncbi:hypothetical protein P879_11052 [Paragonimus westermani]|uniref:DZF domain-containing protein n=1 Tax=Paragonimus westermani TaxID=34504 RepID=A0A8T0D3H4_9TREM|nr:hypothetical protein P879_11052 [Paragonimus westermani]
MDHFGTSHLGGGHHISEQIVYYPQPDHPISGAVPFPRTSGPPPYSGPSMSVYAPPPRVNGSGYPPNYGMTQRHSVPPAAVEEFSNYGGSYRGTLGTDIGDADFSGCDSQYSFGVRPLNLSERRGTSVDSWRGSLQPRHPSTKMYSRGPERFYPPSDVPAGPRFPPRFTHSGYSPRGFRGSFAGRSRRGGLNPGILDSDAVPRRPVSPLYCELCKVSCAGPKAFGEHQNGQRHKKRIAQNEAIERLQKTSDGAAVLLKTVSPSKIHELRCDLCDVGCTGAEAYAAHLAGKAHQRTLRLHRDLGKPIPETEPVPVSSTVAKPAKKAASKTTAGTAGPIKLKSDVPFNGAASSAPSSDVAAASATTLPQSTDASILPTTTSSDTSSQKKDSAQPVVDDRKAVGAEFIDVITGSGGKGAHYRCNLCECQFTNADAKELHLKGRRHRVQYKKKVDSTLVIEPKSASVFHKKVARNERPSERGSLFPPPRPGGSAWTASIGTNDQMPLPGQPFGRFDFRNQAPTTLMQSPPVPFPEMTIENRYMGIKHSQIIPTELEAKAMKTAVSICEHALKDISDNLLNSMMEAPDDCFEKTKSDSESDQDASCSPREKNADKSCFPSEEDRFLRGVVRIGSLGKCLLLRGDHEAHLALVCAEWPTTEAVNFVHEKLTQRLMSLDHRFAYDVSSIPPKGLITIRVSREEDADEDTPNEEDTSPETLESVATQQWPTIIVHIQFTSSVVGEAELVETETNAECFNRVASGAVKADGERPNEALNAALHTAPEQPSATTTTKNKGSRSRGRPMFAHGERVDKISCLDALDAIDQAKWFQVGQLARV